MRLTYLTLKSPHIWRPMLTKHENNFTEANCSILSKTIVHCSSIKTNREDEVTASNGTLRLSDCQQQLVFSKVLQELSEEFPHWLCTARSAGTLCSVYMHTLIHLSHSGDRGALSNDSFTFNPWLYCHKWVVGAFNNQGGTGVELTIAISYNFKWLSSASYLNLYRT